MQYNKKIPFPNQVIKLSEIKNLKFYNVSFCDYLAVYDCWVIGVYPFVVNISSIYKGGNVADNYPVITGNTGLVTYDYLKIYSDKSGHHHNDFVSGTIDYDPCIIYEEVSGIRIHHGESDNHMMSLDHKEAISNFDAGIISHVRDKRLGLIGI